MKRPHRMHDLFFLLLAMLLLCLIACNHADDDLLTPPDSSSVPTPDDRLDSHEPAAMPTPAQLLTEYPELGANIYDTLERALQQAGYTIKSDMLRSTLQRAWAPYLHQHDWESNFKSDCYYVSGEGIDRVCLQLTFTSDQLGDPQSPPRLIHEGQSRLQAGPQGLIALADAERLALIERYVAEAGITAHDLYRQSRDVWGMRYESLLSDRYHHYFRTYSSDLLAPADGEPAYLLLIFNTTYTLIGTAVLPAPLYPTVPASPLEWYQVTEGRLPDYLNHALGCGAADGPPYRPLREVWSDYYLGSRGIYEYYLLEADSTLTTTQEATVAMFQNLNGVYSFQKTFSYPYTAGTLPPSFVLQPSDVAGWAESQRITNLRVVLREASDARSQLLHEWSSYLIDTEADRDHYGIQAISRERRMSDMEIDTITVVYDRTGSVTDVMLGRRGCAATFSPQTLTERYEYASVGIASWIEHWLQLHSYDNVHGQAVISEALSAYYLRSEAPDQGLARVDYYRLPGWDGQGDVPEEYQLWMECYLQDDLAIGTGKYIPTYVHIIV